MGIPRSAEYAAWDWFEDEIRKEVFTMEIKARVPGMVVDVRVKPGDQVKVKVKDVLVVLEAMKMEQSILSPVEGTVAELNVEKGDRVRSGEVLAVVE